MGCNMQILYIVVVLDMLQYANANINILLCMFTILIYLYHVLNKYSSILFIFTQIDWFVYIKLICVDDQINTKIGSFEFDK